MALPDEPGCCDRAGSVGCLFTDVPDCGNTRRGGEKSITR